MPQAIYGTFAIAGTLLLASLVLKKAHRHDHGGRKARLPPSEWGCLMVLRLASWLLDVGTAWDGAILRYRIERTTADIEMESTAQRERRAA